MVTLRYLTSGSNFQVLEDIFRISNSTISLIIPEVCNALWNSLHIDHIKCPATAQGWLEKAKRFEDRWNYPQVLGAIDGKHIQIQAPGNSDSVFRNYEGGFSIVLLVLPDADYQFMYVNIGTEGGSSDSGIFEQSSLKRELDSGMLNLPAILPNDPLKVNYHIQGDDTFGLSEILMKPYPNKSAEGKQHVFNYRLSRARRVIESTSGIMTSRCYVLQGPILQCYENAVQTIKARLQHL